MDIQSFITLIRTSTIVLVLALLGCSSENPTLETPFRDLGEFTEQVQPVIRSECAFLGCHGREGMPLVLYAVDYLRLRDPDGLIDPSLPALDERALSTAELEHNHAALAGRVTAQDPTGDAVIRRMLPLDGGGLPHADVVVFESRDDPGAQILQRFLEQVNGR